MTEQEYIQAISDELTQTFSEPFTIDEVKEMLHNQGDTAEQYWNGLLEAHETAANYQKGTKAKPDKHKDPAAYAQWLKDTQPYEYWPWFADLDSSKDENEDI